MQVGSRRNPRSAESCVLLASAVETRSGVYMLFSRKFMVILSYLL